MNRNPPNNHPLPRSRLPIDLHLLQPPQRRLRPLNNPPENRILPIQMRRCAVRDEELTPVGAGPAIGHADGAARVVAQRGADLVVEGGVPDRGAAFAGAGWVAGLDHEAWDGAVEGGGGVVGGGAEGEEVLGRWSDTGFVDRGGTDFCGLGDAFAEDFDFEVAEGGVELGDVVVSRRMEVWRGILGVIGVPYGG